MVKLKALEINKGLTRVRVEANALTKTQLVNWSMNGGISRHTVFFFLNKCGLVSSSLQKNQWLCGCLCQENSTRL